MSILYCSIPHFATALRQRQDPSLGQRPLVLIDPEGRVFAVSEEASACGIVAGLTARMAQVRCPQARLMEADVASCRAEFETLLQVLEVASPRVEPHGWGAAYVDLGDLAPRHKDAAAVCGELGRAVRHELGQVLQPTLGWDSTKFTAQVAARRSQPGRLLAVPTERERSFLGPLPVTLLPLDEEAVQRLGFLGLRTLGQYAALPPGAVLQQFGPEGKLAQRCARGEDDRPVVPRTQERRLATQRDFEDPLDGRDLLLAVLRRLVAPLLLRLRSNLQACGQLRLTVHCVRDDVQEREHAFLFPTADETRVMLTLGQLLDGMHWRTGAMALQVVLEKIQDGAAEQLALFPAETEKERKLREVQRYLTARFGANRLRRALLAQPGAPLPEWRVSWQASEGA
jgi:nucleotidyltransferase/DNA polymerase involved in DNA repair